MTHFVYSTDSQPGFSFENCLRNKVFENTNFPSPTPRKTGTTIAGITFEDGVILGADTRATDGTTISDKNSNKIHFLAKNIYCCGSGTAADTEMITNMISAQLELHRFYTNRVVPVCAAKQMLSQFLFRYQGYIGAALVLGGVDVTGPHLYSVYPHGSADYLPYATMGSGSLAAMGVFEGRWKPALNEIEGKKLVRDAIAAGIFNDLASGANVDLCVIRKGSYDVLRTYEETNKKMDRNGDYHFSKGSSAVLNVDVCNYHVSDIVIDKNDNLRDPTVK